LNENHQNCLNFYLKAAEYSLQANDTVSYAENMEQASSMYGRMNQFKKAKQTFENVLPIIKASNYKRDIAISYSNFSNTLSANKNYKEAILYNDTAIYLASQVSDSNLISVFWDNMSYIKILEGNYTEAIAIAKKCIDINLRNRWFEPLINNYSHLEEASAKTNNYKDAYNYLIEYHFYNDSIKGTAMQIGINNIESKYVLQKKELDHQLQISKVNNLKKWLERLLWMILCVTAYLIFLYRKRNRKLQFTENELQIHKENLANLTQTLLLKISNYTMRS
jgi:tetratricopeptide (TPR) repeat protein